MDRAKNGLALVRKLPQEPHDVPCALTIQSRGRFVQEQQQFWLGGELDTDRKTLAGFNVQRYGNRVGERLKLQKFDDLLDIRALPPPPRRGKAASSKPRASWPHG